MVKVTLLKGLSLKNDRKGELFCCYGDKVELKGIIIDELGISKAEIACADFYGLIDTRYIRFNDRTTCYFVPYIKEI